MKGDTSAFRLANAGRSPMQHWPLYSDTSPGPAPGPNPDFVSASDPVTPITSKSKSAVDNCIARPSKAVPRMADWVTPGESGATPPAAAAIQLATEKNDPMSTIAGNGSLPLRRHRTVLSPVGCVDMGISTSCDTSIAPDAMHPGEWKRMALLTKSNSTSNLDKNSRPSIPPMTAGRPDAARSVTTALRQPSDVLPTLTPSMVTFCRRVSPIAPRPLTAAPSVAASPSISRILGLMSAVVAPESMRKSTNPASPTSRATTT
mmetsp:Transcript_19323/g.31256  ORF Transcript_19323/g.31256 Transcript_19323/m.31256 type:complete len:261 (-) Transcript_19323:528-1310(-)